MNLTPASHRLVLDAPPAPPLLHVAETSFREDFDCRPFLVAHRLAGHPLFELPRVLELARSLPPPSVEFNATDLPLTQAPNLTPHHGLPTEEAIRGIEECRSWLVLKNVEQAREYRELLHSCLAEVEGLGHPAARGIDRREGFVVVSSPGLVVPYHLDRGCGFLLQVRGTNQVSTRDPADRGMLSEADLERFHSGAHWNMADGEEHQPGAALWELRPGLGLHIPVAAPHRARNGGEVSVSFRITFQTRTSERRGMVYQVNHFLRRRGLTPAPVGCSPWRDAFKYNAYRVYRGLAGLVGRKPQPSTDP